MCRTLPNAVLSAARRGNNGDFAALYAYNDTGGKRIFAVFCERKCHDDCRVNVDHNPRCLCAPHMSHKQDTPAECEQYGQKNRVRTAHQLAHV
jgi:hypothetical protein